MTIGELPRVIEQILRTGSSTSIAVGELRAGARELLGFLEKAPPEVFHEFFAGGTPGALRNDLPFWVEWRKLTGEGPTAITETHIRDLAKIPHAESRGEAAGNLVNECTVKGLGTPDHPGDFNALRPDARDARAAFDKGYGKSGLWWHGVEPRHK